MTNRISRTSHRTHLTIRWYNQVRVLFIVMNNLYGPFLFPASETILVSLSVYGIVGAVRFDGAVALQVGGVGLVAL
jgi:hypothetical protein